jgi:hypothetical protein
MKQLFFLLLLTLSGTCHAQLSDESLHIDTSRLVTTCDCQAAFILNMKESVFILREIKRVGKGEPEQVDSFITELKKRDAKHYEVYTRCMLVIRKEGKGYDCNTYDEGEKLNKEVTALRAELHL